MRSSVTKNQRCAVYTRKSTEHNLDLAFNSLDAQREACEAYIKSQAHEGWRLQPKRFDDGGLSGASLDRPALQALLDEVRARRIDIIVVYKVDRLTRSLADFAKLVELFDAHDVSFVSVTQSFNTTSSMGRLTLNVLLSFAQFEREVIGERVRDKIAASKRKGIWVGGALPIGYRCRDRKVEIVEEEAEAVRSIFARYLATRSVGRLKAELADAGIISRSGFPFGIGALAHLLRNRSYVGEVVYRGEICPGPQPAILDRTVFDAVQACLDAQAVARKNRRAESNALLTGRLFDERGNRLTPSHTNKRGIRYRYYVSQAVLQNQPGKAGSARRLAAEGIEAAVIKAIRRHHDIEDATDHDLVETCLSAVTILQGRLRIEMFVEPQHALATGDDVLADAASDRASEDTGFPASIETRTLIIPWSPQSIRRAKGVRGDGQPGLSDAARDKLLLAIGKARRWMRDVAEQRCTYDDIAQREGCGERYIRLLAPLAFLAPSIVQAIHDGSLPADVTASTLPQALPHSWAEQEKRILRS